jgi:hypothetical protein
MASACTSEVNNPAAPVVEIDPTGTPAEPAPASPAEPAPSPAVTEPATSVESANRFSMDSIVAPRTFAEHLDFLSNKIRLYNEMAPELWRGNHLTGLYVIVKNAQNTANQELYLISADGTNREITLEEALELGADPDMMEIGYHHIPANPLADETGTQGFFLAVNADNLNNWTTAEPAFGPMEPFRMGVHEGFHSIEQTTWADPFSAAFDYEAGELLISEEEFAELMASVNAERDEFLDYFDARVARRMLIRDLRLAAANPDDENLVLQALATYHWFRAGYPEQHDIAINQDRGEGTAFYFDTVASLRTLFPDTINSRADLAQALAYWTGQIDYENRVTTGLVLEGYYVGMLSAVILDRYVDTDVWQQAIMDDYNLTPLMLLDEHFAGRELPPITPPDAEFLAKTQELIDRRLASFSPGAS